MMPKQVSKSEFLALEGAAIGASRWFAIDQSRIDQFADVTEDHQFIHIDPDIAKDTPFGTTIAHGFLTLSMLSAMAYDALPDVEGSVMGVNYGFDKIRFLSPVQSGARVRGHFNVARHIARADHITTTYDLSVEIEGQDRPALIAEWIGRRYFEKDN